MSDELPLPKNATQKISDLEKRVAELEKTCKALLVAMQEVNDYSGRECMPEGNYLGVEF